MLVATSAGATLCVGVAVCEPETERCAVALVEVGDEVPVVEEDAARTIVVNTAAKRGEVPRRRRWLAE